METLHPEAFVCANDRTAGRLMHTLMAVGDRIAEVEALRVISRVDFREPVGDDVQVRRAIQHDSNGIRRRCPSTAVSLTTDH